MGQPRTITVHEARRVGMTRLLVYCGNGAVHCSHKGVLPIVDYPDDMPLGEIETRCRCTACGAKRADLRPDYSYWTN